MKGNHLYHLRIFNRPGRQAVSRPPLPPLLHGYHVLELQGFSSERLHVFFKKYSKKALTSLCVFNGNEKQCELDGETL